MNVNHPISLNQEWLDIITEKRDTILGTLVLVSQIPAETFNEYKRASFVLGRMSESNILETYQDDAENVIAILKGHTSRKKIIISASMDTHFGDEIDHNVTVTPDRATGAGIANNSLGLAALMSLPDLIQRLGLEFDSDLVFLGTTKSLGKGDLEGMRHFLKTFPFTPDCVINIAGTTLGRIDHFSQGAVRGDISCVVEGNVPLHAAFGQNNAIIILNELVNSLLSIPITLRPKTRLNIGIIKGGESYSTPCPAAHMHLYVNSEEDKIIESMMESISDCCLDISSKSGSRLDVSFFGRQRAAGLRFTHPLVRTASQVIEALGFKPLVEPTNTQITVPLARNIPSITLGITTGVKSLLPDGYVELENIPKGLVQVLTLLDLIDKDIC